MNKKGCIAFLLVIMLLFGGCGNDVRGYSTNSPDVSDPEATPVVDAGEPTEPVLKDYTYAFDKFRPEDVVVTINDIDITWREYFYRVSSLVRMLEENFGEITAWDEPGEIDAEVTRQEWVEREAMADLRLESAIRAQARDKGVVLSEAEEKELNEEIDKEIEQIKADGLDPDAVFATLFLTKELYVRLQSVSYLYKGLFNEIYGEKGENCSTQETEAHIEENKLIYSKHILLMNTKTDEETQETVPLTEEELAEKLALAEDILAQLDSAEDKDAKFNELMAEYTEDSGYAHYPNGYVFSASSSIVPEYRTTMEGLLPGEYSGVVESQFGYHVIMRMEIAPETVIETSPEGEILTVRYETAITNYDKLVDAWANEADLEIKDSFKDLAYETVFGK